MDGGTRSAEAIVLKRALRAADLFCGAGGFTEALTRAAEQLPAKRPLRMVAVNHWQTAINTHQANHAETIHFCADLEHLKPRDAVPDGILDILLAAPACTFHSRARGGRPVHDQQRMDPWHVVRWCTELRVHRLLVENVPEFMDWGPCDVRTGRPIKARRGEYFRAWVAALEAIGFRVKWRVINCANHGDATTRERFFLIGRSDRKALRWPEPGYARGGDTDLLGTRRPWRAAAEIIDWSRLGTSIFTRKRSLVKNTLARLLAGAKRNNWPQQHIDALQALIDGKEPRLHVTPDEAEAIALQLGIPLVMSTGAGGAARGVHQPLPTITGGLAGMTPHFAQAIVVHKANSDGGRSARGIDEPLPTVTTAGGGFLARPIIAPYYGSGSGLSGKSVDEPLDAQGTRDRHALATPTIFRVNQGDGRQRGITSSDEPLPTLTGSESLGVATPFLVPNFGERPGQPPRVHSIDEPVPAITASGHLQLARPFVSLCTHGNGANVARPVDDPLPTVTTAKGGEMTLATPALADGYYIDILYRMLHWTELARATGFEDGDRTYHFTGTATEITKQIGNAVPIRTGMALCAALLEDA